MKKIFLLILAALGLNACGSGIPFDNQFCAVPNDNGSFNECDFQLFKKPGNKSCAEAALDNNMDPNLDWEIVNIDEADPCFAEL